MRSKVFLLASILLPLALGWVVPGDAANAFCGMVVTSDLELNADLTCPDTGLIVGDSFIKVDLNGHTLLGTGEGIGIDNRAGYSQVRVTGGPDRGVIDGFSIGVHVSGASGNRLTRLEVRNQTRSSDSSGGFGVLVESTRSSIIQNLTVMNSEQAGIVLDDVTRSVVKSNAVLDSQLGNGLTVANSREVLVRANRFSRNSHEGASGLELLNSDDIIVQRNRVKQNSIGIRLRSGDSKITDNVVSENSLTGILIEDGATTPVVQFNKAGRNGFAPSPSFPGVNDGIHATGGGVTLKSNFATLNADLGIEAFGVVDGNRNRATRNGNPLQCIGVVCATEP